MPEVDRLFGEVVKSLDSAPGDLAGRTVLVTAGPTYEPIDPVRFIGNRSSGKMGFAVAAAAAQRGAKVTLISGPVSLRPPGTWNVLTSGRRRKWRRQ
jgi:phosphopantothenoylcysteine decarboxylase/phosphopantothenate--cysteine ligase